MTEVQSKPPASSGKGKAFFNRADEVAETGNWDFAIQMYLEGIRRETANMERGHRPLREVALKRTAQGGKPMGMLEAFKHRGGKDPAEALVNAETLLSKDPGNVTHMTAVLKAARQLGHRDLIKWISDIIVETQRQAKRPKKGILMGVIEAYEAIEEYASAVIAADMAVQIDPDDGAIQEKAKNLSARQTIQQGQYDSDGSFVKSVRNMDEQMDLAQRDQMSQSREFLEKDINRARHEYTESPTVPGKIDAVVEALLKLEEEGFENEAIDILAKAHVETKAYRFKLRQDDVKIRQMRRRFNALKEAGNEAGAREVARDLLKFELVSYAERVKNYPTDLSLKFELGRRQLAAGQIDDAIAALQQAQREPKRRITAMTYLGQAFARKGWHREAVETFERALEFEPSEERAKSLHYSLAQSLTAMDEKKKALDHLSMVAQMDYNYRDVREQVERLRKEMD